MREYLRRVQAKVRQTWVEPGSAVDAIAAQSIGETGTQITLKTFFCWCGIDENYAGCTALERNE